MSAALTQKEREQTADFDPVDEAGQEPGQDEHPGEEPDGQMFVLYERGQRVTLSTLIKRGTKVQYQFKLDGYSVGGGQGMGLIGYADPERTLVVPGRAGKVVVDPTYDPEGRVEKVVVRQHFKPTMVYDAATDAGRAALAGE